MRILIVDDELVSRAKMQKILEQHGSVDSFENGAVAIEAFEKAWEKQAPYELVLLDVVMPEMDGMQVLHAMRKIESEQEASKRARILMVTAKADKKTIICSVKEGCDGFVVKPFDSELISGKLKTLGIEIQAPKDREDTWQGNMRHEVLRMIEKFKRGHIELPVLPEVVQQVEEVIAKPDSTVNDLSDVIEKDAVTAVKLIAAANSPMYRGLGKIQSVSQAITRMGFKETQKIVMTIASRNLYKTENKQLQSVMKKMRSYSIACAYGSSRIASRLGIIDTGQYFLLGLVHDIGNVLLLWMVGELKAQYAPLDLDQIMDGIQSLHGSFGGVLLDRWQFPENFVSVARLHEGPDFTPATPKEVLIVNLAGHLAFKIGFGFYEQEETELADLDSAKLLKLSPETLDLIGQSVKEMVQQSSDLF